MSTDVSPKPRPYWHVDAKWVTGILLISLLNGTFLIFLLTRITAPEQGIEILTVVLASSFSREGLDQAADLEIMHQKIAESPDGAWQPIPALNIVMREEDISGLTPREMRLWFFRQLAEPIYYGGQEGLADLAADPEMRENMQGGIGPLGFISAQTHSKLNGMLIVLSLVSLTCLGLLIYFSHRFGRLESPGCVILLSAVPGVVAFSLMREWVENQGQNPNPAEEVTAVTIYTEMLTRLAVDALPGVVQMGLWIYLFLSLVGMALMLAAVIGALMLILKQRRGKG